MSTKCNTIDYRGLEQVVTRKEAEQAAATYGYEMMYFGASTEPQCVDSDLIIDRADLNPCFMTSKELNDLYATSVNIHTN